ncbi:MAG TPA: class I adenylate-forming enzyme family protein [Ramlibacter sp.]|nr:class I adenylate-forming enzyme family protein [Ramlibacter sp.]
MDVIDAIRHHARLRPNEIAVIQAGGHLNYLQLAGAVAQLALRQRGHGIAPGARVAIYVSDPLLHLLLALAAMVNGAATLSAQPGHPPVPANAGIDVFLADRELPFSAGRKTIRVETGWLAESLKVPPMALARTAFRDGQALCRLYTSSGTTGRPKVIGQTLGSLVAMTVRSLSTDPVFKGPGLAMMTLAAVGGFGTAHSSLWHGNTVVLASTPQKVLAALGLYGVATLRASPQQLQGLVDWARGQPVRFPRLERIEVAGASLPAGLLAAARATLCTNVVGGYGSTEAGGIAQAPAALLEVHPDAAGYVRPDVDVRIAGPDGAALPPGQEGIIQVRTPYMNHYVDDPEATAAGFVDGWFVPGDLGILEAGGVLRITGRADEMINIGGIKLNPQLVDETLLALPGVRDAAAFARRMAGGDQVWAAVVRGEGFDEEAVLAACRSRLGVRAPVRLQPLAQIPRNAMGKPLRQQLTQQAGG